MKICGQILGTDCVLDWGHDGDHQTGRLVLTVMADGNFYTTTCSAPDCNYRQVSNDMFAVTIGMRHARDEHGAEEVDVHIREKDPEGFSGWMMGCSTHD